MILGQRFTSVLRLFQRTPQSFFFYYFLETHNLNSLLSNLLIFSENGFKYIIQRVILGVIQKLFKYLIGSILQSQPDLNKLLDMFIIAVKFRIRHSIIYYYFHPIICFKDQKQIYSIMQIVKKNLTGSSSDEKREHLPRFAESLEKRLRKKPLSDLHGYKVQKIQRSPLTQIRKNRKNKHSKDFMQKRKLNFEFLNQNYDFMNRTLNMISLRNYQKSIHFNKLEIIKNFNNHQIKYDKTRKQDWMTTHKRVATNICKFNDLQQRKIYRSRKKYFENSLSTFSPMQEKTKCYDGVFPMTRLNSTLTTLYDKTLGRLRLFLVGGLSSQMSKILHFHQYQFSTNTWVKVQSQVNSNPQFNLSQHILLSYQNTIIVIGGIAVIPSSTQMKNERYNIPFISSFSIKTKKWSRINWNSYIRAHAGANYGQYGIIDGGINEQDKVSTKIYLMDLSKSQAPTLVSHSGIGLCHHKIISTQSFEDKNKSVLKFDGLLCFGGKKDNGQLNKNLYLMNYDPWHTEVNDKFKKFEWSLVQTYGKSPQPRYMHSMDLLETKSSIFERKAYCAVLGGIGQNQNILQDFWLFDLSTLQWSQIKMGQSQCPILQTGIAGHCTTATKNQLFIFGGYNEDRYNISKFWTINCQNNFRIGKKQTNRLTKQEQLQKTSMILLESKIN